MNKSWETMVEEIDGEYFITLPPEVLDHLDLHEGDTVVWEIDENNKISLRKG